MKDLDIAKDRLYRQDLNLVIVKNGEVLFETRSHKISGFFKAVEDVGFELRGAVVADKVVGKAIALLCVNSEIAEVYAEILSAKAKLLFEEKGVRCEWKELVDNILDLKRSSVCPFEKIAATISDPKKAYEGFKVLLKSLENRDC